MYGIICARICVGVMERGIHICSYMCRLSVEGYSRNSHDDLGEGELKGWEAEGQGAEEASFSGHILLQTEHF